MKIFKKIELLILLLCMVLQGCQEDFLEEVPLSDLSNKQALSTKSGFENYIIGLHEAARNEISRESDNLNYYWIMSAATDIATHGHDNTSRTNYNNLLRPTNNAVAEVWDWAYRSMLLRANTVIISASSPSNRDLWETEEEKNAIIAEAKFFRAYTHNMLTNLYKDVPLIDTVYTTPKTDFQKSSRLELLTFAKEDLEFASQWLPPTVAAENEGRIVKAAADHLLTEVYISLNEYDKAVESANKVINSGLYELMTERFGSEANEPGDVFSDLFRDGNQNRSSGNRESIYVWQYEDLTLGGQGNSRGNLRLRYWGSWYSRLNDPNGDAGMVVADSLGRGVGQVRPNSWFIYELWRSDFNNDIRNSKYNIRRDFYYNNPSSAFFKQKVQKSTLSYIDSMRNIYPIIRKVEGNVGTFTNTDISFSGRTFQDIMVFRLAETYLLRAEAFWNLDKLQDAANDINKVRARANASLITASNVTLDYILDERARELIVEEPRRRTLVRTGKLVERVRKYNMREITRNTIQDYHRWWPIPQSAIDENIGAPLGQNTGY